MSERKTFKNDPEHLLTKQSRTEEKSLEKVDMHRRPPPVHPCDASGRAFHSDLEIAEFKKRQQLRENSVEIRELEAHLRQAYINKELAYQKKHKETLAFQRQQEILLEAQLAEENRRQYVKEEEEAEKKDALEKIKYKQKLDGQVQEKQDSIHRAYQAFLQEKQVIDDIIAKVKAEERKKVIESLVKKQVAQEEIQEFIESQKKFVVFEKERVSRENEEIKRFIARKDAWVAEQEKVQSERRVLKNDAVQRLGEELEARRVADREKEALLHELNERRQVERERMNEALDIEREIRRRLNFKQANDIAKAYRDKQLAKIKAEDEMWKRRIMDEAEKAAKLDQMSDQKRRMKMLEVRREADKLLEERQKQREVEKAEEALFWMEQKEVDRMREDMIEEERQKILKEHAEKLIGFLPTQVLSEEDLEMLGRSNVKILYKTRQNIDPLAPIEQQFEPSVNY